jgi:hypothetical protein
MERDRERTVRIGTPRDIVAIAGCLTNHESKSFNERGCGDLVS